MANRLAGITIDCADPARLASFWSALLDIAVTAHHSPAHPVAKLSFWY